MAEAFMEQLETKHEPENDSPIPTSEDTEGMMLSSTQLSSSATGQSSFPQCNGLQSSTLPIKKRTSRLLKETSSDIIIEDEPSLSRSSSPEVEVLEVCKSKTPFTVDLTADDGDDEVYQGTTETLDSTPKPLDLPQTSGTAPVLDISDDDSVNPIPSIGYQEPMQLSTSTLERTLSTNGVNSNFYHDPVSMYPQISGEQSSEGNRRLDGPSSLIVKSENETISLMKDLEYIANLPLNTVAPSVLNSIKTETSSNPTDLSCAGSSQGGSSSGGSNFHSFKASSENSIVKSELPVRVNVVPSLSVPNFGSVLREEPQTMPSERLGHGGVPGSDFIDNGNVAVRQGELPRIPAHPFSAFQAVTPSASNPVPDAVVSQSGLGSGASSAGIWNRIAYDSSGNLQSFDSILSTMTSFRDSLSMGPHLASGYSQGISNSREGFLPDQTPHYVAGPSISSGDRSQSGRSGAFIELQCPSSSILPVLSPDTVIEHTLNFTGQPVQPQGSYFQMPTSVAMSTNSISDLSYRAPGPSAPERPLNPPSPDEPTISCTICMDSLRTIQSSSRQMCSTRCGHVFCNSCLEEFLKKKKECPVCRKKLNKKQDYHPLFI